MNLARKTSLREMTTYPPIPFASGLTQQKAAQVGETVNQNSSKVTCVQQKCIYHAFVKYKHCLRCVKSLETGTLVENGAIKFSKEILKCISCNKQTTGTSVIGQFDGQIGKGWEPKRQIKNTKPTGDSHDYTKTGLSAEKVIHNTLPNPADRRITTASVPTEKLAQPFEYSSVFITVPAQT